MFPMLTRMAAEGWTGLSVLYLCPLKALLNNLLPRLEVYGAWAGRRVALWHGDTPASRRKSILTGPPDLLLTTPESLESMLVSPNVDHTLLFRDLRAVIVDEVHAFGRGTGAGTCSRFWSGYRGSPGGRCSGSGCRPPSATPRACCTGCRALRQGNASGVVVGQTPRSFGKERCRARAGPAARLCRLAGERGQGDRGAAPGREAAGVLRLQAARREARRGAAGARRSRRTWCTRRCRWTSGGAPSRRSPRAATA